MKVDASLIILFITIASAIAAYWSNVEGNKQLDRMEQYDSLNNKLNGEVMQLSTLNNMIANRIDTIVSENNSLTQQNIALTNKTNVLVEQVEKLTAASNALIKNVDIRTEKTTAENVVTGEINLEYERPLEDNEKLTIRAGGFKSTNFVGKYKEKDPPQHIIIDNKDIIPLKIVDGKIKFSVTVYDLSGNLLAEVKENVWRRNPNSTCKFNYDSRGFEIIDNRGFTALSVNLDSRTQVSIEGYFFDRKSGFFYIYGGNSFQNLPITSPIKEIFGTIERAHIRTLFEYSGKNWIGKRK